MVKAVKKESRRMDRLEPRQIRENGHEVWWSPHDNVKRIFLKHRKRWGWTVGEAEEVFADCCSERYGYLVQDKLEPRSAMLISGNSSIDVVMLSTKGRKLIEKSFFIFPTGLWYAWYEEDGKKFFAITGAIITLLLAIVGLLTKITFFDKHH
jgi:hypothetical protein